MTTDPGDHPIFSMDGKFEPNIHNPDTSSAVSLKRIADALERIAEHLANPPMEVREATPEERAEWERRSTGQSPR